MFSMLNFQSGQSRRCEFEKILQHVFLETDG